MFDQIPTLQTGALFSSPVVKIPMMGHMRTRLRYPKGSLYPIFIPSDNRRPNFLQTLKMESKPKRPTCPTCSKPAALCLCIRIRKPNLENSVNVTILLHSLETKHALNSTRIAKLGLKNLTVTTVSDVESEARFLIRLVGPGDGSSPDQFKIESSVCHGVFDDEMSMKLRFGDFDGFKSGSEIKLDGNGDKCRDDENCNSIDSSGNHCLGNGTGGGSQKESELVIFEPENESGDGDFIGASSYAMDTTYKIAKADFKSINGKNNRLDEILQLGHPRKTEIRTDNDDEEPVVKATIIKQGSIRELSHAWMQQPMRKIELNFEHILDYPAAKNALAKGFVVKRFQKKQLNGSTDLEEHEEFEIKVPHGSVLLFPSDAATSVNDLMKMGFKVKNLIVLDGTWAKAKRMYVENPWLKLLPHVRLDLDGRSLYNEVRHQPKAGYLSTIESIVYTMKEVGEYPEGLDNLLEVFESMVEDQRRCKKDRLRKLSM